MENIFKTYDIIGDIAVIKIPKILNQNSKLIAEAIMNTHKKIKSVYQQTSSVSGDYRLRKLKFLLGEEKTKTFHREHGCIYKIDLDRVYFSPRLSYERLRISKQVKSGEIVLNMFAGAGCFSICIALHAKPLKVYSVDINPFAFYYLQNNILLNKVENVVTPIQGDAKTVITDNLTKSADRILMPLPEIAYKYLHYAFLALKPTGGWIHYYDFEYAKKKENPIEKVKNKISKKLDTFRTNYVLKFGRIVRPIGPRWYQIVLDILIQN